MTTRTRGDGELRWSSYGDNGHWRAWATALYPDDKMPPYYRISKFGPKSAWRRVELIRPARVSVSTRIILIGDAPNLAKAKVKAQINYDRRR